MTVGGDPRKRKQKHAQSRRPRGCPRGEAGRGGRDNNTEMGVTWARGRLRAGRQLGVEQRSDHTRPVHRTAAPPGARAPRPERWHISMGVDVNRGAPGPGAGSAAGRVPLFPAPRGAAPALVRPAHNKADTFTHPRPARARRGMCLVREDFAPGGDVNPFGLWVPEKPGGRHRKNQAMVMVSRAPRGGELLEVSLRPPKGRGRASKVPSRCIGERAIPGREVGASVPRDQAAESRARGGARANDAQARWGGTRVAQGVEMTTTPGEEAGPGPEKVRRRSRTYTGAALPRTGTTGSRPRPGRAPHASGPCQWLGHLAVLPPAA